MKTSKKYVIGESSERLLKALDVFGLFQTELLEALEFMYGELKGGELFAENTQKLEEVERIVMEYLRINFTSEMGTGKEIVTL